MKKEETTMERLKRQAAENERERKEHFILRRIEELNAKLSIAQGAVKDITQLLAIMDEDVFLEELKKSGFGPQSRSTAEERQGRRMAILGKRITND